MKILVSACLLGKNVRYDGGNCLVEDLWLSELISKDQVVSLCPEMEAGMGTPRAPIEINNGRIVNQAGEEFNDQFAPVLNRLESFIKDNSIVMAIMKESSPSCGVREIYDGSFSGHKIQGTGVVSQKLSSFIPVFSENELAIAKNSWDKLTSKHP
ncbi:MAG: DUF523 domain-containing protein [Bacteriovoracaceae bacterium]|nr:DUF523 domain-containing protein [Bacteriovoracaceae bacterium]